MVIHNLTRLISIFDCMLAIYYRSTLGECYVLDLVISNKLFRQNYMCNKITAKAYYSSFNILILF